MTDLFENPMGLDGFEFVEYAAAERGILEPVFEMMGFSHVASHRSKSDERRQSTRAWRLAGITSQSPKISARRSGGPPGRGLRRN